MSASAPESDDGAPFRIGEWVVDPRADELHREGRTVKLEPLRMRLLVALARRPGEVVFSNELLDTVWKGAIVTPSSLYQTVAQLRQHLGDDPAAPTYIETVPRKGYRLIAPVSPCSRQVAAAPAAPAPASAAPGEAATPPVSGGPAAAPVAPPAAADAPDEAATLPFAGDPAAAPAVPPAASTAASALPARSRRAVLGALVAAVAAAAAASLWWTRRPAPAPRRIAVLPLADVSAAGADESLARGLTADLTRALTQHPQLEVVSTNAVLRLATGPDMAREAARLLTADVVLQGDLNRDAGGVRATLRLTAQPAGDHGAEVVVEVPGDRLAHLPPEMARRVLAALDLPPLPRAAPTVGTRAYELYLRGIEALRTKTADGVASARRFLDQSVEADPQFARSYSALGSTWIVQWEVGGLRIDRQEAYARAEPLYAKALQIDPQLVEARLGLASVASEQGRFDEARRAYEAVVRDYPSNVQARFGLAMVEEIDGWPTRAIAHYQRAALLDPTHFLIPLRAGLALTYAGRLAEAQASFERCIALDVRRPNGYYGLGVVQSMRGELAASISAYRLALQRGPELDYLWSSYAFVCLDSGLHDDASRAFERAASLLRAPNAMSVTSAYAWLAAGAKPPVPPALEQKLFSPAPWERLWILAIAGQPVRADEIRLLEDGDEPAASSLFDILSGRYALLERATLYAAAGLNESAGAQLAEVDRALAQYRERGVTGHGLDFHRARVSGLRGDRGAAIEHLRHAVQDGWRRTWWTRRDPAFATLAGDAEFTALLRQMDVAVDAQRRRLAA